MYHSFDMFQSHPGTLLNLWWLTVSRMSTRWTTWKSVRWRVLSLSLPRQPFCLRAPCCPNLPCGSAVAGSCFLMVILRIHGVPERCFLNGLWINTWWHEIEAWLVTLGTYQDDKNTSKPRSGKALSLLVAQSCSAMAFFLFLGNRSSLGSEVGRKRKWLDGVISSSQGSTLWSNQLLLSASNSLSQMVFLRFGSNKSTSWGYRKNLHQSCWCQLSWPLVEDQLLRCRVYHLIGSWGRWSATFFFFVFFSWKTNLSRWGGPRAGLFAGLHDVPGRLSLNILKGPESLELAWKFVLLWFFIFFSCLSLLAEKNKILFFAYTV